MLGLDASSRVIAHAPFGGLGLLIALAAWCPAAHVPTVEGPPLTRTVDTVDREFGLEVADPYRRMEGIDHAEYKTWLAAQGAYAAKQLAALPGRDALLVRDDRRRIRVHVATVRRAARGSMNGKISTRLSWITAAA